MANVMSPIIAERIWALPLSGSAVKFLQYLVSRSDFGGTLPVRQKDMAAEYGVTPQAVSGLMAPLCDLNIVLRPRSEERNGNSYRLHPLAAKYESPEDMEAAFRSALVRIQTGDLPNLKLPTYQQTPPSPTGRPKLQVA
ncbi:MULTISPECIES: hypothetical protein [unclassified Streptomyces]|uniref:hypothetical protein n=1 Tax=unclassified Streptomyces TaxID=2593676 RepID=UPI002481F73B|nr:MULTISPECIES: hypothetical protein [unclassified Streptomyces]MDA5284438.1 hypothetical protein [Streptomyces sp. Isolate_45]MDX2394917.1 hypothetical protein [Streptomyces sp. DK15]